MLPNSVSSKLVFQHFRLVLSQNDHFMGPPHQYLLPTIKVLDYIIYKGTSLFQTNQSAHIEIQNKLFFFCPDTFQTPTTDDSLTLDKIIETLRPKILEKIVLLIHHLEADFIGKKNCTTVVSNIQDRIFGTGRCIKETLDGLLRDVLARKFNKKAFTIQRHSFEIGV